MSDPIVEKSWFLEMNTMLNAVITNSTLVESHQQVLCIFEQTMNTFFADINEYQLNSHQVEAQKQQAVHLSQQYMPLLSGLSQLYLACQDPETARGRFDYGKERTKREKQQQNVIQLVHFVQKFYTDLVQSHPQLPVPEAAQHSDSLASNFIKN